MECLRIQPDILLECQRPRSILQLSSSHHGKWIVLLTGNAPLYLCDNWDILFFLEELQSHQQSEGLYQGLYAEFVAHQSNLFRQCLRLGRYSADSGSILPDKQKEPVFQVLHSHSHSFYSLHCPHDFRAWKSDFNHRNRRDSVNLSLTLNFHSCQVIFDHQFKYRRGLQDGWRGIQKILERRKWSSQRLGFREKSSISKEKVKKLQINRYACHSLVVWKVKELWYGKRGPQFLTCQKIRFSKLIYTDCHQ